MGEATGGPRALELELAGEQVLLLTFPVPAPTATTLTAAERDVVRLVLQGATNAVVARTRGSSPSTVSNQLQSIFRKLGVASRAELAHRCAGSGALASEAG